MAFGPSGVAGGLRSVIIGASGLVGSALQRALPDAAGTYRTRPVAGLRPLDASDADALRRLVASESADVIFLPAAQPDVEWCESHPAEAEAANLDPVRAAIEVAREARALLVAYSSDYVFDGAAGPYREEDATAPISAYGRIKRRLEELVLGAEGLVIRTTGVFGPEPGQPRNFVLRLVGSLRRGDDVRVPLDQVSTPTYADDLAAGSVRVAERRERGLWHLAGPDLVARDELARRVARAFHLSEDHIISASTESLRQLAPRPLRGGLAIDKARVRVGYAPRSLDDALVHLRTMVPRDG